RREPAAGEARCAGEGRRRSGAVTPHCGWLIECGMRNAELNEMSYLTRSPISLDALLAEVSSAACGGTCLFLGTVRNGPEEQGVTAIEYSAYEEMVEAEFGRLLADAEGRWPEA